MSRYRWGIVGTGGIAKAMLDTLRALPDTEVVAVASHTPGRAGDFAAKWGIPIACNSVRELTEEGPDAAYVGSANHHHLGDVEELIKARVPILCEKPLTTTSYEADRIIRTARKNKVFLMEAMWMRFLPFWDRLNDLIGNDAVGPVRTIRADFGFRADDDPGRRWFSPAQGGGALLDIGIYPVTFAIILAGMPSEIEATGTLTSTGVDAQVAMAFRHDSDVVSVLDCSIVSDTPIRATVSGPKGRIELAPRFFHTPQLSLYRGSDLIETFDTAYEGSGYRYEVEEVHRCISAGLSESTVRPLADTLDVLAVLDKVRTTAFR